MNAPTLEPLMRAKNAIEDLPATLGPIGAEERAEWWDALRGFALLGILLINITAFSGYAFVDPATKASLPWSGADVALEYWVHALVEAKFYSLFSFLFGLGFAVQLRRAEARGGDFRSVFRRRMGWLLAFGLAHAFLVWFGDILNFYALMGFVLLAFRKASARTLLRAALACLGAPVLLYAIYLAVAMLSHAAPVAVPDGGRTMRAIVDAYAHGDYGDVVHSNAMVYAFAWVRRIYRFQLLRILGMFLLGAWAGKIGLTVARDALRPMLQRWLGLGVLIGLPMNLVFAGIGGNDALLPATATGLLSATMGAIGIPLLTLSYVAVFALYYRRLPWIGTLLVSSGRMALSHYLAQSVVCVSLFYGIGLGWFRQVGFGVGLLIALCVYLALSLACRAWLARHAQGPMEALWRRLAYARQPQVAVSNRGD